MNPINRVGQKVVCVLSRVEWVINVCSHVGPTPQKNETYTVSGFAEDGHGCPSIHLREVEGYDCACLDGKNLPWDLRGFRPLRTSEEDISVFTAILKQRPVRLPDDEQIDG